jgi:Na+/citrate or Na+/malate symporter
MEQIIITDDRVKVRQLFFWSTLMLALLVLIPGLMLYLVGDRLFIVIEIISGFALVVFLVSLLESAQHWMSPKMLLKPFQGSGNQQSSVWSVGGNHLNTNC